jgi:ankyrin repeat domain-containing protein 50
MLSRIPHDYREYARQILALLCCAERPLTVEELAVAVAFHPEDNPRFNAKRKLEDVNAIHEACPGFVYISDNKTARLAHFSVREYLESDRILQDSDATAFSIKPQDANTLMTSICLSFFLDLTVPISDPRKAPLTTYAARNWPDHFRRVDTTTNRHRLEEQVFQLFSSDDDSFESWAKACILWPYHDSFSIPTPLCASVVLGLEGITTRLIEVADDTSLTFARDATAALRMASRKGHRRIVELLLQHDADIDMSKALFEATKSGHKNIIQLLLNQGAEINP